MSDDMARALMESIDRTREMGRMWLVICQYELQQAFANNARIENVTPPDWDDWS